MEYRTLDLARRKNVRLTLLRADCVADTLSVS